MRKRLKITILLTLDEGAQYRPSEVQERLHKWLEQTPGVKSVDQCIARKTTIGQPREVTR